MKVRIATPDETEQLNALSLAVGNIPFVRDHSIVAVLEHGEKIVGFAATQEAMHAAGSWIDPAHRRRGLSYRMREALDQELRRRGYPVYFALPNTDFERQLFKKYGPVTERLIEIREL